MCLLKVSIVNNSGDGLGDHGVERLWVLDGAILGMGNECIHNVGKREWLVLSEDGVIGISSSGYREYAARRGCVPFRLVHTNTNVGNEWCEGLKFSVPWFRNGRAGVGVDNWPGYGENVKWCGCILRIEKGYACGLRHGGGGGTGVHVEYELNKALQGGGDV